MGRPYAKELDALVETYNWATQFPLNELTRIAKDLRKHALLAVGSGGSLAAATFAAAIHETYTGRLGRAATPMDAANISCAADLGVLFLSAGGKNADVRGALASILKIEPQAASVICFSPGSPLSKQAKQASSVELFEHALPGGKDGFLSVNSLLAFSVLLLRAYAGAEVDLPLTYSQLMLSDCEEKFSISNLRNQTDGFWDKRFLLLVHGADLKPAAVDMESKFSEAALGAVQIADLRNFAHGRHHWLAKYPNDTAVIFLVTDHDLKAATRTRRLIPRDIQTSIIHIPGNGFAATLRALICVFHLANFAGNARGIDPGRPGVPEFGSRIYSLNIWGSSKIQDRHASNKTAVDRKVAASGMRHSLQMRSILETAYNSFLEGIIAMTFHGLICDYDGTLVDPNNRFDDLSKPIALQLNRILKANIPIGIATGRGSSVRDVLLRSIAPQFHSGVYIGYHNCAEIVQLTIEPPKSDHANTPRSLLIGQELLERSELLSNLCTLHPSPHQIGVRANEGVDITVLHRVVLDTIAAILPMGVQCLLSTHSVDIVPAKRSKEALLIHLRSLGFSDFLTIGDMGQWPGNDFALLHRPFSLSSNEVSTSVDSCWNLAPPGLTNARATEHYLKSINLRQNEFTLDMSRLLGVPNAS